jgi:SAM-dependent methyltransferase
MKNIDINKTIDAIKLKWYHEWLATHIYDEGHSGFHQQLTAQVMEKYVDPLNLPKEARILDMGCGPGYFLDELKKRGYTNYLGITLSEGDINICANNGHPIESYDLSFLPQVKGFYDESVDFIFCRHALEHSPYPLFTLIEYNRVLGHNKPIYIELPAPDCERLHEFNLNHYSILGERMWAALLQRTGFSIEKFENMEFDLTVGKNEDGTDKKVREHFYCIIARKTRPLDLK